MPKSNYIKSCTFAYAFGALNLCCFSAYAASYDPSEYNYLIERAKLKGFAHVQIGLNVEVSLEALKKQAPTLKAQLAEQEKALIAELGDTISKSGRWQNGLGQIGVYATLEGLQRITNSVYVKSFGPTVSDTLRSTIYDDTGTLRQAIEAEIAQTGKADVEAR